MLLDFEYIVITFNLLFGFVFGGKNRKENKLFGDIILAGTIALISEFLSSVLNNI
jgi:hypothetical protein